MEMLLLLLLELRSISLAVADKTIRQLQPQPKRSLQNVPYIIILNMLSLHLCGTVPAIKR